MESLLAITLFVLLGAGTAIWHSIQQGGKGKPKEPWEYAAVSCGLQPVEPPNFWKLPVGTGAERLWVRFNRNNREQKEYQIVVTVPGSANAHILADFHSVSLRPQGTFHWGMREIEIGDKSFDQAFFIEGPARVVLPLLDTETRRLLLRLSTQSRLSIPSTGRLEAEVSSENIPVVLPLLLDLGRRFAQPLDIPRRLAENARQDLDGGVRLQNLLVLIRELPQDPRTVEALRTACSDPNPQVRFRAAKELGAEGHGALLELAESPVDDALRAEAISILDRELPFESARAILASARGLRHFRTARACLEVLGRSGAAAAVDVLAKVLSEEKGGVAAVAAQALGTLGNPAAEPALILALQSPQKEVRVAAANALGRVGSVAAVPPLKEAAESSRLDLDLRRATRQAIAEIQSRLQGASPGQLSLAGAEAGQLSLVPAEAGQLSIVTDQAGQLSISGTEDSREKDGS